MRPTRNHYHVTNKPNYNKPEEDSYSGKKYNKPRQPRSFPANYGNKSVHIDISITNCDDSFDKMIKKFNKKVNQSKILKLYMSKRSFVKPSQIRHNKDTEVKHKILMKKIYGQS